MRTVARVLIGLIAACLAAALVKVLHVITPMELWGLAGPAFTTRLYRLGDLVLLTATHQALFVLPLALIAAVVTEVNRIRGWLTYAILGVVIAVAGFYLQYTSEGGVRTIVNPYAAQAYIIEGGLAGLVYWLIAGRFAGWRRGGGLVKTTPFPLAKPRMGIAEVPHTDGKPTKSTSA